MGAQNIRVRVLAAFVSALVIAAPAIAENSKIRIDNFGKVNYN